MYKEIYERIKEFNTIVICRHIGVDPDALCSQLALRDSIKLTYPDKKVLAIGTGSSKFIHFGKLDKLEKVDNALLIVCDTPDRKRIDSANPEDYAYSIKIDHHPFVEKTCDLEYIDDQMTSACEIIMRILKVLRKKKTELSKKLYLFKLAATSAIALTFLVTFAYLVPVVGYGFKAMIMNSNLFFHLITPLLAIFTFILFENTDKIGKKEVIVGIVPTACYAIYYLINIVTHMTNGKVSPEYDWYFFMQGGIWTAFIVVPLMLLITYLISLFLWKINKTLKK